MAVDIRVERLARPKVSEWLALQQHDEHEDHARNDGHDHDGPQDPNVDAPDRNAHQENADGDLAGHGREAVGNFAEPPVLFIPC